MLIVFGVEPEPWSSPPPPPLPCCLLIPLPVPCHNRSNVVMTAHLKYHIDLRYSTSYEFFLFSLFNSQVLSFSFHYVSVYRVRWKCKWQQNKYTETTIHYPDGFVAVSLCKDGPTTYHFKEDSGLSDEWIRVNVSPNITHVFGPRNGSVLGRAALLLPSSRILEILLRRTKRKQ